MDTRLSSMMCLAALLCASSAAAQTQHSAASTAPAATPLDTAAEQSEVTARELFRKARELLVDGRVADACELFARSNAAVTTTGSLLNLGLCNSRLGDLTRAHQYYRQAHASAIAADDEDRTAVAAREMQRIAPLLGAITLLRLDATNVNERVVIELDGEAQPRDVWGLAMLVNPGAHTLVVRAHGATTWQGVVEVGAGQQRFLIVPQPKVSVAASPKRQTPTVEVRPAVVAATASRVGEAERGRNSLRSWLISVPRKEQESSPRGLGMQRMVALGTGASAVIAAGVAAVFGLMAQSSYEDSNTFCRSNDVCSSEGVGLRDEARANSLRATVTGIGAGVALLGAGALWFSGSATSEAVIVASGTRAYERM